LPAAFRSIMARISFSDSKSALAGLAGFRQAGHALVVADRG
jgi:hypothetical protein